MNTRTNVKVIEKKGETVLVEFFTVDDVVERVFIPAKELGDNNVLDSVLDKGIPYGYPWDEIEITFDSNKFKNEMHQAGVWTPDDAMKYPQSLWTAINQTLADNITKILNVSTSEIRRNKNG